MSTPLTKREYGLDWLRIISFGLLILYHLGMFYVEWGWHVKSPHIQGWLDEVMRALNPWRLPLLFLISGAASRHMLGKLPASRFMAARTSRLFPPILLSVVLVVPPQSWLELVEKAGYAEGFLNFWLTDYFEFGSSRGFVLPTWNHMWFVVYLWLYSLALGLMACVFRRFGGGLQGGFDLLFGGWRWLVLPFPVFLALRLTLHPVFGSTHALVDDFYNHAEYGFVFLLGFGMADSVAVRESCRRYWRLAVALAVLGYVGVLGVNAIVDHYAHGQEAPPFGAEFWSAAVRTSRTMQMWAAVVALLGVALRFLDHDNAARRYLTEAIFPYYILHQTLIVVAGHYLARQGFPAGAEFLLIAAVVLGGCTLSHELIRRTGWLRPWFGLKPAPRVQTLLVPRPAER